MPLGAPNAQTLAKYAERLRRIQQRYDTAERPLRIESAPGIHGSARAFVPRRSAPVSRRLLVTGTGRCGTKSLARALQLTGHDMPHERTGADGTVSHWFALDADWYPILINSPIGCAHVGERRSDFVFEHVVHLVRHPVECINSMVAVFPRIDYLWYFEHNLLSPDAMRRPRLFRCIDLYYQVNRAVEALVPEVRYRLEDIQNWYPELLARCHWRPAPYPDLPPLNRRPNFYRDRAYSLADMLACNPNMTKVIDLARGYGYSF